MNIRLRPARY